MQPRPPSEQELAENAIVDVPNNRFFISGRMMEPSRGFETLPGRTKGRKIKPPLPPPIAIDRRTGEVTLLPVEARAATPSDETSPPPPAAPVARTPALNISFEGMNTQSAAPSDAEVAAGPDTLIQAVNDFDSKYRLYDKSGGVLATANQSDLHGASMCCDARAVFDPHSQRYFLSSLADTCTPTIGLAMSKTASPTNLTAGSDPANDWLSWLFVLPGTNRVPDFPIVGVDEDAVYLTGNVFSCGSLIYRGVTLTVIPKAQLLAGAVSPTATAFTSLTETWTGQSFTAFSVIPPISYGRPGVGILPELTAFGSVSDDDGTFLDAVVLTLYIVNDPASATPTLSDFPVFIQDTDLNVPDAPQSGSAALIETNDPQIHGVTYRDGSLWVSQTVVGGAGTRIFWNEIDVARALDPATFLLGWEQGGFIQDASRYYYYPKITTDAAGNAAVVMCGSSTSEFASAYYATRASDDAADTFQTPALLEAGTAVYDNPPRWGDYSGICVDPSDGTTFWATAQWAKTNNANPVSFDRWSTQIASFNLAAQTTTLPFFEDFEAAGRVVTPGLWSLITGVVDGTGENEPSGVNSARLNGPPRGQDQFRTRQIDLSAAVDVELSYWLERGGTADPPEALDLLTVDYVNADGNWANLATYFGSGAAESSYMKFTHSLPTDGYHEHFRLRFSSATSFTGDDWFIDDVSIRDCGIDADSDGVGSACELCPAEPALLEPDEPGMEVSCADGVDNDCDGLGDGADPDCGAPGCPFTCFDIDGDGNINLFDFGLFAACFATPPSGSQQCLCSDFNGDDEINLTDFGRFALFFGSSTTFHPPDCP